MPIFTPIPFEERTQSKIALFFSSFSHVPPFASLSHRPSVFKQTERANNSSGQSALYRFQRALASARLRLVLAESGNPQKPRPRLSLLFFKVPKVGVPHPSFFEINGPKKSFFSSPLLLSVGG
jgi:hypothetical protein